MLWKWQVHLSRGKIGEEAQAEWDAEENKELKLEPKKRNNVKMINLKARLWVLVLIIVAIVTPTASADTTNK